MTGKPRAILATLLLGLGLNWASPARAQEVDFSGFGTLGYAQSNRSFTYQRFITQDGGIKRDSLLGVQADVRLSPKWSATLQVKAAPALKDDQRWELVPTWAFVAWRPNDDWLLRAGRLRMPIYLYSESMDVGQTHDMARLPTELYSIIPTPDFEGLYVSRNWALGADGQREATLDVYTGGTSSSARFWLSNGLPPAVPAGPSFWPVTLRLSGLALTVREPGLLLRSNLSRTNVQRVGGLQTPVGFPYVPLGPGLGYYQVSDALPGPGVPTVGNVRNTLFSLGAEVSFGQGWRATAEVARNLQLDTVFGVDATAGYVALFKQVDRFTPYVSLSRKTSRRQGFDWYRRLTATPLPSVVPGADLLNAAQRAAAESYWLADQRSLALGSAYAISPKIKLKAEWLRTHIGEMSHLVDTPPGQAAPHNTSVDVLSLNLNFAF